MIPLDTIRTAAEKLKHHIIRTPIIHSSTLSQRIGADVYLKLENLQKTGSFKVRGATYKLIWQRNAIGPGGVVTASAGNHAQGVALAARETGVPATVVMPEWASITKQEATRSYGGDVVIYGTSIDESLEKARALSREGRMFIHPFDDEDIVTGQGTMGLEIFEDIPDADMILVPIGGGGLISGIASAARGIRPETDVIGVEAAVCPSASESRKIGKVTRVAACASIADGISVKQVGDLCFAMLQEAVADVVLVEEEHITAAMLMLLERKRILAEGSGAAPLAALLNGPVVPPAGGKVVLVISGGNVDSPLLGRIISQGLLKHGRIMRLRVLLEDIPGALAGMLAAVARQKANVLTIYHDRRVRGIPITETLVELELETRGPEHAEAVAEDLRREGYELTVR